MLGKLEKENLELNLLLESIQKYYGYDFRNYARASLMRRANLFKESNGLASISDLIPRTIHDPEFFSKLVYHFSITYTEMFRDPLFYKQLILKVFPVLETHPYIKIWHAGCATGEEVYSTAIMLKEAGIYDRCTIFATDFNDSAIEVAKAGIYRIDDMKHYIASYHAAGGRHPFSNNFTAGDQSVTMAKELRKNITFANHNLVLDGIFGEMHLILCRNVLIYFNKELQNRVLELFCQSLVAGGFLCLGTKESLRYSSVTNFFTVVDERERIYKKRYETPATGDCTE